MSLQRVIDFLQLAVGMAAAEPTLRLVDAVAPAVIERSAYEPYAHRGRSFIATAPLWRRSVFLAKMLFTFGASRRRGLARQLELLQEIAGEPPATEPEAEPRDEIIFLGDLFSVDGLGRDRLSDRLRGRLLHAKALVFNLEGTVGANSSELFPLQSWRGVRQMTAWRGGDDEAWVSRMAEEQLGELFEGLPPVYVNLANNHVMDEGSAGLERTVDALERLDVGVLGIRDASHEGGVVVDVGSRRIGLVAVNFGYNHAPLEEPNLTFQDVPYELPVERLRSEYHRLADDGADYLVASLHWGYEHEHLPRPEQLRCAAQLWELGFSGIVGHHPHIVQPCVGHGERWVAFSLGDFIGGDRNIFNRFGYALSVKFPRRGVGAPHVEAIPYVQTPYSRRQTTMLLDEAPSLERALWSRLYETRIAVEHSSEPGVTP